MIRTQVYIPEKNHWTLTQLALQTGKSRSELIRTAIDSFCLTQKLQKNRLKNLKSAKGIWKDRDDLPDLSKLRKEFERKIEKGPIKTPPCRLINS